MQLSYFGVTTCANTSARSILAQCSATSLSSQLPLAHTMNRSSSSSRKENLMKRQRTWSGVPRVLACRMGHLQRNKKPHELHPVWSYKSGLSIFQCCGSVYLGSFFCTYLVHFSYLWEGWVGPHHGQVKFWNRISGVGRVVNAVWLNSGKM